MNIVQKSFNCEGIKRITGEILDLGRNKNLPSLISHRFLGVYEGKAVKCKECSRSFDTQETLKYHNSLSHIEIEKKEV